MQTLQDSRQSPQDSQDSSSKTPRRAAIPLALLFLFPLLPLPLLADSGAADIAFMLFCASLVLLMTPSLAVFYAGLVRSKNVLNTLLNCTVIIGVVALQWVLLGYTLAFGEDIGLGLLGDLKNFALDSLQGFALQNPAESTGFAGFASQDSQAFLGFAPQDSQIPQDSAAALPQISSESAATSQILAESAAQIPLESAAVSQAPAESGESAALAQNYPPSPQPNAAAALPEALFMIFQMLFAVISAAIIVGALVERVRFGALVAFVALWSTLVYDPLAHWVWSENGWLLKLGSLDFAGGGVVHISAGFAGLVGCLMLGKRKNIAASAPHNIPFAFLGGILLWIGWIGFNAGSALKADGVAILAFITTNLAAAAGILGAIVCDWLKNRKITLLGAITGAIAGLVSITPGAGFVTPLSAIVIGFLGAIWCFFAITWLKNKLGYDDSLDVFGLHGVCGIWGGVAVGLFATSGVNPIVAADAASEGLIYGGFALLGAQCVAIFASIALSSVGSFLILKILSFFTPLRVDENSEEKGLDDALHGEKGYGFEI